MAINETNRTTIKALEGLSELHEVRKDQPNRGELQGRHVRLVRNADGDYVVTNISHWDNFVEKLKQILNLIGFDFSNIGKTGLYARLLQDLTERGLENIVSEDVSDDQLVKASIALETLTESARQKNLLTTGDEVLFLQLLENVRIIARRRMGQATYEAARARLIAPPPRPVVEGEDDEFVVVDRREALSTEERIERLPADQRGHFGQALLDARAEGTKADKPVTAKFSFDDIVAKEKAKSEELHMHGRIISAHELGEDPLLSTARDRTPNLIRGLSAGVYGHRRDGLDDILYIIRNPRALEIAISNFDGFITEHKIGGSREVVKLMAEANVLSADMSALDEQLTLCVAELEEAKKPQLLRSAKKRARDIAIAQRGVDNATATLGSTKLALDLKQADIIKTREAIKERLLRSYNLDERSYEAVKGVLAHMHELKKTDQHAYKAVLKKTIAGTGQTFERFLLEAIVFKKPLSPRVKLAMTQAFEAAREEA